jgi:phage terminase large subunit-like protein
MSWIASLPKEEREEALRRLSPEQLTDLLFDWKRRARPEQLPPDGDWTIWLYLGGRGAGKTRSGAEYVRALVGAGYNRIALVAPTAAGARDVMVEGESGLMGICPPGNRPVYYPSTRRVIWPSGALATLYSADEPERLRGPQHDAAWADEVGSWRYPDAWDMLMFGMRLGKQPRAVVTTTPRPTKLIRDLMSRVGRDVVLTRGSSYQNFANLAPAFLDQIIKKYEGTRLGRQELEAALLEDTPGALWTYSTIEGSRHTKPPDLKRIVVAIDPAVTSGEDADETGIVVAGKDGDQGYVLADYSGRYSPREWAERALRAYREFDAGACRQRCRTLPACQAKLDRCQTRSDPPSPAAKLGRGKG